VIRSGARTYEHRAGRKSNSNAPRCVHVRHEKAYTRRREMKYVKYTRRKERPAACATKNPSPGAVFNGFNPRICRGGLLPPFSSLNSSIPFAPKSNQWRRMSYEAAIEDNWILIWFLLPFCSDTTAVLLRFLPTVFLSIYLAFPMTRDEHTAVPVLQCFLWSRISGGKIGLRVSRRSQRIALYYLIDRGN